MIHLGTIHKLDALFKNFNSYHMSVNNTRDNNKQWIEICNRTVGLPYISSLIIANEHYKYNPENDVLSACMEYNNDKNEFYLYFRINTKRIEKKESTHYYKNNNIKNGKIKLDFDKFEYLFALTSLRCGCERKRVKGFEFEVSFTR